MPLLFCTFVCIVGAGIALYNMTKEQRTRNWPLFFCTLVCVAIAAYNLIQEPSAYQILGLQGNETWSDVTSAFNDCKRNARHAGSSSDMEGCINAFEFVAPLFKPPARIFGFLPGN
jgi:hypothetical protein